MGMADSIQAWVGWCVLVGLGGHVDLPQWIIWCIVEQVFLGRYTPPR